MSRFKLLLAGILLFLFQNTSFAGNAISNLITPVSYFVDHVKQLDDLKNNLTKYRQASIVGTSGIGKTQLARTYAYENKDKYNLIWFFDCNIDINHEFVRLAKQLNEKANAGLPEEPKQSKKALMDYLKDKDNWLLVFDNLKINENKKVQDLLDWEHNGNVIFCSQGIEAFPYTVAMSTFTNKDSLTLISKLLENKNKDDTNFLVKAFSGYPILIVQGTQLLNQIKGMDKENYKKRIYQSAEKIKLNVEFAMKQLTPSACQLLSKIALINSKNFSKDLLKIITDFPNNLNNDIFQLTKFMLITCIDSNEANPIFEMHDVIAQKTMEINNNKDNKQYLEDIITRLVDAVPKSVIKGRVFRSSKTIAENFEVIFKNAEKYSVDICKIMELNSNLTIHYANSLDFYSIERKISWFNENDKNGKFKPLFMSNDQKASYGAYLGIIGSYYRHRYADYEKATEYFVKSAAVFDKVHDYEFYKFNIICQLALINIGLGKTQELSQNVQQLEEMLDSDLIDREDIAFAHYIKARLLVIQGKYLEALKQINNAIEVVIKNGLNPNDLFLTSFYLLKTDVLSSLSRYQEAYVQIEQLYNMHKPGKKEDHQIFGRIYTQMAKAELGLGGIDKASDHITKALVIFLADEKRNPKNGEASEDPDLAAGYVVQGDILTARGDIKQAIENYRDAQKIYFYLYKNNSGNIAQVSDLYLKGAKAACKLKDLYHYKAFGLPQVREFGNDHPNTITMLEYCKQYDMDLWKKEN